MMVRSPESLTGYAQIDLTSITQEQYVREVVMNGVVDLLVRSAPEVKLTLYSKRAEGLSSVEREFTHGVLKISSLAEVATSVRVAGNVRQTVVSNKFKFSIGTLYCDGNKVTTDQLSLDDHWVAVLDAPGPIESLSMHGCGDAMLRNVYAQRLSLNLLGAGDIQGSGEIEILDANILGSGDIDLIDMRSREARLQVLGSGDIRANVREAAEARVVGSGDISVYGNPPRQIQHVLGTGSVRFR